MSRKSFQKRLFDHNHKLNVLKWPPKPPDVDPIENLWNAVRDSHHGSLDGKTTSSYLMLLRQYQYRPKSFIKALGT